MKWTFLFVITLLEVYQLKAQNYTLKRDEISCFIYYRHDNHQVDLDYLKNKESLEKFFQTINSIGLQKIDSVIVVTESSPDGVNAYNKLLTKKRTASLQTYIKKEYPDLFKKILFKNNGGSWELLRNHIIQDNKLNASTKTKAIQIIDSISSLKTDKEVFDEHPEYWYIRKKYYPLMRNSRITTYFTKGFEDKLKFNYSLNITSDKQKALKKLERYSSNLSRTPQRTLFTIKNNLLYDVLTAINIAIEVPLGNKWSIEIEDVCPWWHNGNKWAFQILELGAEGRYWIRSPYKNQVLTGHFGGVYVMGGKYDLQNHRKACYQGNFWSVGCSYGYVIPIGKRFNMEFALSLGFLSTKYQHYTPSSNWDELVKDPYKYGRTNYFGPTKAKISLIYPFKIKDKKKGICYE